MKPREIRKQILADHAFLRGMLDELDQRAIRVLEGRDNEGSTLRDYGLSFLSRFTEHLAFEDRFLGPALEAAGPSGIEHAKHLTDDHREQRELLSYILAGLEDVDRPAQVVAGGMRDLVELILRDMALEEETILKRAVLRDPVLRPSSQPSATRQ